MRNVRNDRGFTLIELMIVVVIIGILAAIAIPRFTAVSASAKQAEAGPILKQICSLAEADNLRNDEWPDDLDAVTGWDPETSINAKYFSFDIEGTLAVAEVKGEVDGVVDQQMDCTTGVISNRSGAAEG